MTNIGQRIHDLRIARKMTLEQVGDICGVGKSTVYKWETGDIENMRRDKIALLAKALGVDPVFLMGWADEPRSVQRGEVDEIREAMHTNPDLRVLYDIAKKCTPDELRKSITIIKTITGYDDDGYEADP